MDVFGDEFVIVLKSPEGLVFNIKELNKSGKRSKSYFAPVLAEIKEGHDPTDLNRVETLKLRDILLSVNGEKVIGRSLDEVDSALQSASRPIRLEFRRPIKKVTAEFRQRKRTRFLGEIARNTQRIAHIRKTLKQLKEQTATEIKQVKTLVEKIRAVDNAIDRITEEKRSLPAEQELRKVEDEIMSVASGMDKMKTVIARMADTVRVESVQADMAYYAHYGVRQEKERFSEEQARIAASLSEASSTPAHHGWETGKLKSLSFCRKIYKKLMNCSMVREQISKVRQPSEYSASDRQRLKIVLEALEHAQEDLHSAAQFAMQSVSASTFDAALDIVVEIVNSENTAPPSTMFKPAIHLDIVAVLVIIEWCRVNLDLQFSFTKRLLSESKLTSSVEASSPEVGNGREEEEQKGAMESPVGTDSAPYEGDSAEEHSPRGMGGEGEPESQEDFEDEREGTSHQGHMAPGNPFA